MIILYGIRNCDSMKKTFAWLDAQGLAYTFHDYKREGCDAQRLAQWAAQVGWEALINRRGTTWRRLPEAEREQVNEALALQWMLAQPSLIRRPLIEFGEAAAPQLIIGFDEATLAQLAHAA